MLLQAVKFEKIPLRILFHFIILVMAGADPGGHWGQMTPFQTVLILKQALQIIILTGACTLKAPDKSV